jgi:uncharacterized Zn finger protein
MAASTCTKCGNHTFEVKEAEPRDSAYKLLFVQCSSCGGVVGVMDFFNLGAMLQKIQKKLGIS